MTDYWRYIRSEEWKQTKLRYLKSKMPKVCFVCEAPWSNAFEFHHRTYKRLGKERLMDIAPVCRQCHQAIHELEKTGMHVWQATKRARKYRKRAA